MTLALLLGMATPEHTPMGRGYQEFYGYFQVNEAPLPAHTTPSFAQIGTIPYSCLIQLHTLPARQQLLDQGRIGDSTGRPRLAIPPPLRRH